MGIRALVAMSTLMIGCGRVGFDASATDASGDGGTDAAGAADASLPAGAVLYLPFENAPVGATVEDVARGHAVACRTTCPGVMPGMRGNAYAFDRGGPDVLQAPYTADLDPSAGFTIAVWIRMNALPTSTYYCVLGKAVGAGSSNSHALCVRDDTLAFYHSGTVAGTDNLTGSPVAVGEWHHLAMTWDGTTKRGYLDGIADGMRAVPVENDTNPIVIGADLNTGMPVYPLDGALDEVWVFDRALDAAEIRLLAQ